MKASIVIRTKNEARHLGAVLDRIAAQKHEDREVIVVDSGSTDDTVAIAEAAGARVVPIDPDRFTYGAALNRGAREADGGAVVYVSGHSIPLDRDWLGNLLAPFGDEAVVAVTGKTLPHEDCNPFDARGLRRRFGTEREDLPTGSGVNYSNANAAVRRDFVLAHPFDEALPYSEDLVWQESVRAAGHRLVYAPLAVVRHSHNEAPRIAGRRAYQDARARRAAGLDMRGYWLPRLIAEWVAGTVYDAAAALRTDQKLRWTREAIGRRWWLKLGRYAGSRGMDWGDDLFRRIQARQWRRFVTILNRTCERMVPAAMRVTRRSATGLHPKHFLDDAGQQWYAEPLSPGDRVLDLGCDRGAVSLVAAEAVGERGSVVGLDANARAIADAQDAARERGAVNADFRVSDLEKALPVEAETFDAVLALDVIEHLDARDSFLAEIRRVVKPDGVVLLSAPNGFTSWKRRLREAGLPSESDPDHRVEYDDAGLQRTVEAAGFAVNAMDPVVFDSPWYGAMDLAGVFLPPLYRRWVEHKRRVAVRLPEESTGWRLKLAPV